MRWMILVLAAVLITGCAEFKANSQERHERVAKWIRDWRKACNSPQDPSEPSATDEKQTVDYLNSLVGNDSDSYTASKQ
jgi:hypothetical protein